MAGKKGGRPFRGIGASVHIKKNTAGTSNEISLSVLDGLKSRADNELGEADPKVKLGDLSLFTVSSKKDRRLPAKDEKLSALPAPAASSASSEKKPVAKKKAHPSDRPASSRPARERKPSRAQRNRERALRDPEKEIKRRKKNRRVRRFAAIAVASLCCCACIGAAALFAANAYEQSRSNLALLSQAFDEIEKADSLVLSMDDLVMKDESIVTVEELDELEQGMSDAGVHLNAACAFSDEAFQAMGESPGKDAARQVSESADARRDMMKYAEALLHADADARSAVESAEKCWDQVLEADGLMKEAADLVADTTVENVTASQGKSEQAIALLDEAAASLASAQAECPSADFSALAALIEKKREQNVYAVESDKAIYIQDKATAESFNESYNRADAEAVELAAALPERPAQPILDRLDAQTSETRSRYLDARKRAAESDAFIRDYLGRPGE
ncbi:hypothetical protein [uncultured Slackia sp.]|uniref:hypothetical protein n=1 Tax=uncultured Slackia sp. TaxID=665903 RepID=UPI0026DFC7EE|nr:hypothetical protein [uncultured Slackia sp.]